MELEVEKKSNVFCHALLFVTVGILCTTYIYTCARTQRSAVYIVTSIILFFFCFARPVPEKRRRANTAECVYTCDTKLYNVFVLEISRSNHKILYSEKKRFDAGFFTRTVCNAFNNVLLPPYTFLLSVSLLCIKNW